MNKFLIIIAAITLSCGSTVNNSQDKPEVSTSKEDMDTQRDMLLGSFEKEDLQEKPFSKWFQPRYDKFSPGETSMETIKENIGDYNIKVLMGTWCADSRREVPKFLKILDQSEYNYENLEMVAVDYNKTTPSKIEEELSVHRVPTIIFYKDGEEVNRFVEYSQAESLEEDIAKIVSGKKYKDSYAN